MSDPLEQVEAALREGLSLIRWTEYGTSLPASSCALARARITVSLTALREHREAVAALVEAVAVDHDNADCREEGCVYAQALSRLANPKEDSDAPEA